MRVAVSPADQIGPHCQDDWELSTVLVGSGTRVIDGKEAPFTTSEVVLIPPKMLHQWKFDPQVVDSNGHIENVTIFFSTAFLQGLSLSFPALGIDSLLSQMESKVFEGREGERMKRVMIAIDKAFVGDRESLLVKLIGLLARQGNTVAKLKFDSLSVRRLASVEAWIACNYARKVNINQIAGHVGMNHSAFCSWYKRMTGQTFIEAVNNYRLALAARHLLEPGSENELICEIAWTFGFPTLAHFHHLFQRRYGCSPLQYRARHPPPT